MEIILITLTLTQLIAPILENNIDFVVGSEARFEKNSMTQQILELATTLMKIFFNATFTDLGPLEI
jgi:hypothetical protein